MCALPHTWYLHLESAGRAGVCPPPHTHTPDAFTSRVLGVKMCAPHHTHTPDAFTSRELGVQVCAPDNTQSVVCLNPNPGLVNAKQALSPLLSCTSNSDVYSNKREKIIFCPRNFSGPCTASKICLPTEDVSDFLLWAADSTPTG